MLLFLISKKWTNTVVLKTEVAGLYSSITLAVAPHNCVSHNFTTYLPAVPTNSQEPMRYLNFFRISQFFKKSFWGECLHISENFRGTEVTLWLVWLGLHIKVAWNSCPTGMWKLLGHLYNLISEPYFSDLYFFAPNSFTSGVFQYYLSLFGKNISGVQQCREQKPLGFILLPGMVATLFLLLPNTH